MYLKQYFALLSLTVLYFQISFAAFPIHINDFTCYQNDEYCNHLDCNYLEIRNQMQVLNFEVEFIKALNSVMLHLQLFKKHKSGEFKPFVVDATENLCKYLNSTERSNMISRLMPNWKHYGSFPLKCPVKGVVYLRRYPMDLSFYPSTFPAGEFQLNINIIEELEKLSILNVTIAFDVKY